MEVYCQMLLAYDLNYINDTQLSLCKDKIDDVLKLLNGLLYQKINLISNIPTNSPKVQNLKS